MPIYEYTCEKCGHQLEAIQKFSDPLLTDCPECKAPALKKQISAAAFQLKGTGWYATDFRDKGKKVDSTKDKDKDKDPDSKSNDTKPADSAASPDKNDKNEKSDKDKKESKSDAAPAASGTSTKSSSSGEQ